MLTLHRKSREWEDQFRKTRKKSCEIEVNPEMGNK
jgi:hypothetical protein